ncbi:hypothetical protein B0H19DRAFT_1057833 [Mycena capillaripes]|nr:hypothetical protein B0H19DRAFT_1057833 [Mycena capillaripes]
MREASNVTSNTGRRYVYWDVSATIRALSFARWHAAPNRTPVSLLVLLDHGAVMMLESGVARTLYSARGLGLRLYGDRSAPVVSRRLTLGRESETSDSDAPNILARCRGRVDVLEEGSKGTTAPHGGFRVVARGASATIDVPNLGSTQQDETRRRGGESPARPCEVSSRIEKPQAIYASRAASIPHDSFRFVSRRSPPQ